MYRLGQFPGSITGTLDAPMGSQPRPERSKTQWIRLADVAIIGPAMIFSATKKEPPQWLKAGMMVAGIATILYNLTNFLDVQKTKVEAQVAEQLPKAGEAAPPSWWDLMS